MQLELEVAKTYLSQCPAIAAGLQIIRVGKEVFRLHNIQRCFHYLRHSHSIVYYT